MTSESWKAGRRMAQLTQIAAAEKLGVSQPYLSQLEQGLREAGSDLVQRAARLYRLPLTVLPLRTALDFREPRPDDLQREIGSLGYPGFEHIRATTLRNPAAVILRVVGQPDLDTRLVEALPWVLATYTDLDWPWLRDQIRIGNLQNRLGYLICLAEETACTLPDRCNAVPVLCEWRRELDRSLLVREGTLCRESMPEPERVWVRTHRPEAAAYWRLLTTLTAGQLPYAP